MPLFIKHKETEIGIGDKIRITQKIIEGEKNRAAVFEGILIAIKSGQSPSIVVRRVGEQKIGIERIFPLLLPSIEKIEVLKKGTAGVRHGKLYYLRGKSPREVEKIYARANKKNKKEA